MLKPEEESEAEVRRVDQDNINKFARLNARLHELRAERDDIKKLMERLDDACTELMMASGGDKVMLMMGEAFFETSEQEATEHCEAQVEVCQAQVEKLDEEEASIIEAQAELKKVLYSRFGKSIQLEE